MSALKSKAKTTFLKRIDTSSTPEYRAIEEIGKKINAYRAFLKPEKLLDRMREISHSHVYERMKIKASRQKALEPRDELLRSLMEQHALIDESTRYYPPKKHLKEVKSLLKTSREKLDRVLARKPLCSAQKHFRLGNEEYSSGHRRQAYRKVKKVLVELIEVMRRLPTGMTEEIVGDMEKLCQRLHNRMEDS